MCVFCREKIPHKMAREPRINSAIVMAIRMAKLSESTSYSSGVNSHFIRNQDRPDKAFTTEKAKKMERLMLVAESGRRKLKEGNKMTCKKQTSDLKFTLHDEALRVNCLHGYPV
ncbi:hypothetical protein RD792_007841 [Penstemon davidsonii]|uniref:Uncharacterized protein n=1 Tax=Penstemon davidsonii TaxID=160366 RepID=A0ABR0D7G3_9LAMI|nr:hypothetical protein RD792_007841 [Penstemon davidsonii]